MQAWHSRFLVGNNWTVFITKNNYPKWIFFISTKADQSSRCDSTLFILNVAKKRQQEDTTITSCFYFLNTIYIPNPIKHYIYCFTLNNKTNLTDSILNLPTTTLQTRGCCGRLVILQQIQQIRHTSVDILLFFFLYCLSFLEGDLA